MWKLNNVYFSIRCRYRGYLGSDIWKSKFAFPLKLSTITCVYLCMQNPCVCSVLTTSSSGVWCFRCRAVLRRSTALRAWNFVALWSGHWSLIDFFPHVDIMGQGHWHGRCNLDEAMGLDQSFKTGVSMNQIWTFHILFIPCDSKLNSQIFWYVYIAGVLPQEKPEKSQGDGGRYAWVWSQVQERTSKYDFKGDFHE